MSETTSLRLEQDQGVTVVSFMDASILDALSIQRIGRELYAVIEDQGRRAIVLDFSEVRFLSSQALGVLLTLRRKADKAGARVALASIRPELAKVFKMTNLDKLFAFHADRAQAVASLAEAR